MAVEGTLVDYLKLSEVYFVTHRVLNANHHLPRKTLVVTFFSC